MDKILLSFDLEEFDIPEEYGQKITEEEKLQVTLSGLIPLLYLLDRLNIPATFYTTAFFAEANTEWIKKIAEKHEIASHGFYHSKFQPNDIATSRIALQRITGKVVSGFRMPRLMPVDESLLAKAGYTYNASLNPTIIPGRYNNFGKPKKPFMSSGMVNLPASVALWCRIPLFWISFKIFNPNIYRALALHSLKKDHYLSLYFHPWEFADISAYRLPFYVRRICGTEMLIKFEKLLLALKGHGEFVTSEKYCSNYLNNAPR